MYCRDQQGLAISSAGFSRAELVPTHQGLPGADLLTGNLRRCADGMLMRWFVSTVAMRCVGLINKLLKCSKPRSLGLIHEVPKCSNTTAFARSSICARQ